MQAGRGDNDAAATRQETAAAVPDMRPPWNNWFMITYEQTIEKERVGLPRAYPRVRKGYYTSNAFRLHEGLRALLAD
jgi:hypothetical protein